MICINWRYFTSCIFCDITKNSTEQNTFMNTNKYICIRDINPISPVHFLIIPREHFSSLNNVYNVELLGNIMCDIKDIAKKAGISSYRVVINTGKDAGQTVDHLHIHLLGGRDFGWPPG